MFRVFIVGFFAVAKGEKDFSPHYCDKQVIRYLYQPNY